MVNPTTSPLIFSKLLYNIYLPLPIFLPPTNKNCLVIFLNPSPPELPFLRSLPYISLRKHPAVLRDAAREAGNFLLCEFSRAALFFCLIEKPDIKDYRLYRSISSMMSRRLYSRGILCCPPSLLWSRNQASNIPVLAGMISRHSSAILLNRLAS